MITKLTLTIEKEVIARAKKYASTEGRSLSDVVESYLKLITSDRSREETKITSRIKSLKGSFKTPSGMDYNDELKKGLSEKYL